MAKATKTGDKFKLSLTDHEASVLITVLRRIGGDDIDSPRKITDDIKDALRVAGALIREDIEHLCTDAAIDFRNYPAKA